MFFLYFSKRMNSLAREAFFSVRGSVVTLRVTKKSTMHCNMFLYQISFSWWARSIFEIAKNVIQKSWYIFSVLLKILEVHLESCFQNEEKRTT